VTALQTIDQVRLDGAADGLEPYGQFAIEDYGTLVELTADLHIELPTQALRLAVTAFGASSPIPGPGPGGGGSPGGGNVINGLQNTVPSSPKGGTLPATEHAGRLGAGPASGTHGVSGLSPGTGSGTAPGGGASTGGGGGGGGGGGKLPFTGYGVLLTAAIGASFAGAGTAE
jgi:hypothetical protein